MTTIIEIPLEFVFTMPEGAPRCCCISNTCCGRQIPGLGYLEGEEYYPLTMCVTFTNVNECTCLDTPLNGTLDWQGDMWFLDELNPYCSSGGYDYPITDIWLQCGQDNWYGGFTWGSGCGDVTFTLTPTLNEDGNCDPFYATADVEITDPYCCGFHLPVNVDKKMRIEFFECP
jgi:hypothetical protein